MREILTAYPDECSCQILDDMLRVEGNLTAITRSFIHTIIEHSVNLTRVRIVERGGSKLPMQPKHGDLIYVKRYNNGRYITDPDIRFASNVRPRFTEKFAAALEGCRSFLEQMTGEKLTVNSTYLDDKMRHQRGPFMMFSIDLPDGTSLYHSSSIAFPINSVWLDVVEDSQIMLAEMQRSMRDGGRRLFDMFECATRLPEYQTISGRGTRALRQAAP